MNKEEFLKYFPDHIFQTFDDKKEKDKSLTRLGKVLPLEELNKKGAGVFFSPNRFKDGRKAENCTGVNAWFFEIDGIDKEKQAELIVSSPIMPSIVVETRNSLHTYFLAKQTHDLKPNFRKIQKGLISHFGADKACKDITRVLRVPEFYHNKQEPFLVKVVDITAVNDVIVQYSEEEMLNAFPFTEEKRIITPNKSTQEGMDFWESAFWLNCEMALSRLSGSSYFRGDYITFKNRPTGGKYIFCNNKPCNAWLDNQGRIASSEGGPSIIQWLEYYGWDKKEVADIIKKEFYINLPKTAFEKQKVITEKKEVLINPIDAVFTQLENFEFDPIKTGTILDEAKIFLKGAVTRIGAWSNIGKSRLAYWFACKFLEQGYKGAVFSTEVVKPLVLANFVQYFDKVSFWDVQEKRHKPTKECRESVKNLNIFDSQDGTLELATIENIVSQLKDLDFIVIDFCQDISDKAKSKEEYARMSNYAIEVQKLAQDYNVMVLDLSQVNNEGAKNDSNSNIGFIPYKGSGGLYAKTDIGIMLKRDKTDERNVMEFSIRKHKYGSPQNYEMICDFKTNTFHGISKDFYKKEVI